MASAAFTNLAACIGELKLAYLDAGIAVPVPTPDHQEHARAFLVFAHAEMEFFVEECLRELATVTVRNGAAGTFAKASLAMLAFSGLPALAAGGNLSGAKPSPRSLGLRLTDAYSSLIQTLNSNTGVREKHIAQMAIPLGLDPRSVDATWLNDLDAFCSLRGGYAHMSRTEQRASHLGVNPVDIWSKCERLIWRNPALSAPGVISSFEEFDIWVDGEKAAFGATVPVLPFRFRACGLLLGAFRLLRRRSVVR
jgi:hypothetical protein